LQHDCLTLACLQRLSALSFAEMLPNKTTYRKGGSMKNLFMACGVVAMRSLCSAAENVVKVPGGDIRSDGSLSAPGFDNGRDTTFPAG
jgi:hypothetical protein